MKYAILGFLLAFAASGYADATLRKVVSVDGKEPADYVPAMLSNGRLNIFVDYRLGIAEDSEKLKAKRLQPGIYWEGRRLVDNPGRASRFGWELMPQGAFRTLLSVDGVEQRTPRTWEQTLDLRRALTTVQAEYDSGIKLSGEAFVAKTRNVIALKQCLENASVEPREIRLGAVYHAPGHERIVGGWRFADGAATWEATCYGRFVTHETISIRPADGLPCQSETNGLVGAASRTFVLKPGESRTVTWFIVYEDDLDEHLPAVTPAPVPAAPLADYGALRAEHVADWEAYGRESAILVPDARIQELFEMARYHLRCVATEWSIPVGIIQSHWSGRIFAFDEMYAAQGLLAAGHFSTARVAADFRAATLTNASVRCNLDQGRPFYKSGARWVWEAAEGNDIECSPLGFWMDHIFQQAAVAQTVWTYFRYTGDRDYLAQKGYGVIRECALFFRRLQVIDLPDGTSFVTKCTDLERMGPGHERAFMTTCGAIATLRAAAEAADILGKDADLAADFRACAARLVASLPERDGRYIAYPGCTEESMGTLAGFYPFHVFDRANGKQVAAADHFLKNGQAFGNMYETGKRICPWYAATMAMASLRAGNAEFPAVRWLQEAARSGGVWGEYWEINEPGVSQYRPWFMTAAGNVLYAVCQLFAADMEGGIHLAAGVPKDWRDYAFRLPVAGGWQVDVEVKDGKLARFDARPIRAGLPRPRFFFKGEEL